MILSLWAASVRSFWPDAKSHRSWCSIEIHGSEEVCRQVAIPKQTFVD
jgi:hypothetical protein